ncbi:ABC-2 type transport system ATP-binding protein [Chitinophaga costaii]|uniref:ABC-2 type transport system ATP-binding protein n=1 Tax=Chitinophaga costaii TaxID=1335309 RepID=A0A1C4EZ06_9BACT|nr:ATP-binding cassette domain-containing protein [Chitinophaga costaii]PUZ21529.1 ABC transporter [Chitinophaga costaii]SCC48898.1 ABC-2 type transport system ATP-binding protein [Chitinophaga costaii]
MLHISQFEKYYQGRLALQVPSLALSRGVYWIRGANGSGKSTLLKALAGVLDFKGKVLLDEMLDLKKQPVGYRRRVNFAEAEPIFPEFLTGREMCALFAAAKQAPAGQEGHYLESIGLQNDLDRPVGGYSSGMLKKLSLVLAFLGQPAWILLDEPLITMDTAALAVLNTWIRDQYAAGVSFLLSSHQPLETGSLPALQTLLVENNTVNF